MSSDEEFDDLNDGPHHGNDDKNKKRRIQRACDTCRRKKGAQLALFQSCLTQRANARVLFDHAVRCKI